jgi:crossover junction endodeoxyribonuclease RuvC
MFAPSASIVLGIDPGLTRCGYAVLRVSGNTEVSMSALGVLRTSPEIDLPNRLAEIAREKSCSTSINHRR